MTFASLSGCHFDLRIEPLSLHHEKKVTMAAKIEEIDPQDADKALQLYFDKMTGQGYGDHSSKL